MLWIAAITAFSFLTMVEIFNRLSLDDLGFALQLKENSIWNYMMGMYFTWQGRFMGFFLNGIQMKSYFLFNRMLPFSLTLYFLNIFLVARSLINFFKIDKVMSMLFAVILFQLYIFSMFDISSYFWMCAKPYTFEICLGFFALSDIFCNPKESILNYLVLSISFAFLGCSYEIYAPIILLILGSALIYKFHSVQYNIHHFKTHNRKLIFAFFVGTVFFVLMVIAPGNWIRLSVHEKFANLSLLQIFRTSVLNCIQLIKLLFLRFYYYFLFIVLLIVLIKEKSLDVVTKTIDNRKPMKKVWVYLFITVVLCFVSVLINTFAVGKRMELRAFNHINLLLFLFIGLSVFELSKGYDFKKSLISLFPVSLMIIIVLNLYNSFSNYSELKEYVNSENERIEYLERLKRGSNKDKIKLKELSTPIYRSIDEFWKIVVPKYTEFVLIKPNEVSWDINNFYNKTFRKYYNLDFDVYTTIDFGL